MIRRGYVASRYGQLHYREAAPAETRARPLILLHQNPGSSFEYEPLIQAMATDRRVIAFDTPGYGMSDGADHPLSLADCAASFASALAPLGVGQCDAFGFHTGALLAVEFALAAPDAVRHLVVSGLPMRDADERAERLAAALNAPSIDEAGAVPLKQARELWDYIVGARTAGVPLDRAALVWIDKLRALDRSSWAYIGVWSYDYAARLPLVRQPTLLLQVDEAIADVSKAATRLIPDHRIVELNDLHRDIFDLPEAIEALGHKMRAFLDASSPADAAR